MKINILLKGNLTQAYLHVCGCFSVLSWLTLDSAFFSLFCFSPSCNLECKKNFQEEHKSYFKKCTNRNRVISQWLRITEFSLLMFKLSNVLSFSVTTLDIQYPGLWFRWKERWILIMYHGRNRRKLCLFVQLVMW